MRDDLVVPGEHEEDFCFGKGCQSCYRSLFAFWNYVCLKKTVPYGRACQIKGKAWRR